MKQKNLTKLKAAVFVLPVLIVMLVAGCGDSFLGNKTGNSSDLSGIGLTPDASWHDQYLVGAHGRMICADCHVSTAAREQGPDFREIDGKLICYQCHSNQYGITDLFDHIQFKTGTYCNSCHFSDTFWQIARPGHEKFHHAIAEDSNCVACHDNKIPGKHTDQGLRASCEACHRYPNWAGATFDHATVTSGCAGCHSRHYDGSQCEWCHPFGVSWEFRHGQGDRRGCDLCHRGNYD